MRAAQETRMNAIWYSDTPPPWYLRALTPVYRLLRAIDRRRQLAARAADLESKCIIVVGNITVGGSGKTPLVMRLCELMSDSGLSPAVVSRGYGRSDVKQRLVTQESDPGRVGDEPLLIARRTGVPVVVGSDRAAAARAVFALGANVVIADDGLQHLSLPRAIEICVIDGERGFGNGHLLPAGPLREEPERLDSVDHIVLNGGNRSDASALLRGIASLTGIEAVGMDLHARMVHALDGRLNWRLSQFAGCRVVAVAGIGNPGRFFDLLRHARIDPVERVFPDHHRFVADDFHGLPEGLPIIMTEKDAVKCRGLVKPPQNAWYLSVDAHLPAEWEQALIKEVCEFLDEH